MTQTDFDAAANDCIFGTILCFTLPFYLTGAGGSRAMATAVILDLIDAYSASTPMELDLVGRIIGFSAAATDNLRLSMTPGMSDNKVLRYRCNAVALGRASNQAQTMLEAVQAKQEQTRAIPRPSVAAAPIPSEPVSSGPAPAVPAQSVPSSAIWRPPAATGAQPPTAQFLETLRGSPLAATDGITQFPQIDIETMKSDARIMMAEFSRNGAAMPDPAAVRTMIAPAGVSSPRINRIGDTSAQGSRYSATLDEALQEADTEPRHRGHHDQPSQHSQ